MGWQIVFSPQALKDLGEAVRYIAKEDPENAERIGNALIDRVLILEKFPFLGPPYRKRKEIRALVSRPYRIFYRVLERQERIEILRYWHPARGDAELDIPEPG
jgi:addiction module RelE/StbE family toxin